MPRRTFLVATVLGVLLLSFVPVGTASPAAEPRTVTYPGSGLQVHLGEVGKLDETSPGFRRFVHDRLLRLWKLAGSQKCLRRGQFCASAAKRQYARYGFRCVGGRLR